MATEYRILYGKPTAKTVKWPNTISRDQRWLEVSEELNRLGYSCTKTPAEWRYSFSNMRHKVAEKIKNISFQPQSSGAGSPTNANIFSAMDHAIINIFKTVGNIDGAGT